jgi:NitT/TauT family transport system permease protein
MNAGELMQRRSWSGTAPRLSARYGPPLLAACLVLAVWELAVWWFRLPNFVLPTPQEIVVTASSHLSQLWQDTLTTVIEAITGYIAGALLGLAIAIAFVTLPGSERIAMPIYVTINSVPMIAYGPLAIIWFGIGAGSKVALILVAVSYTILVNALAGLRGCDPGMIALMRTFGASDSAILLKLRIPAAAPAVFAGLRVAVVHAMILAVVLEMLGADAGLGWSVYKSTQMMNFVEVWVAVGASVAVSLLIYSLVSWIARRCVWW